MGIKAFKIRYLPKHLLSLGATVLWAPDNKTEYKGKIIDPKLYNGTLPISSNLCYIHWEDNKKYIHALNEPNLYITFIKCKQLQKIYDSLSDTHKLVLTDIEHKGYSYA